MVESFGGSLNLIVWIVLLVGAIYYSYRCLFQTKAFVDQYGFGDSAVFMTRFAGTQVGAAAVISPIRYLQSDIRIPLPLKIASSPMLQMPRHLVAL